jgi:hypothetical protein
VQAIQNEQLKNRQPLREKNEGVRKSLKTNELMLGGPRAQKKRRQAAALQKMPNPDTTNAMHVCQ